MRVIGIIAEFNPFHNGHKYLIEEARRICGDPRAIVMPIISGPFTQRGLPALLPYEVRTKQALSCGADLVLELPFTFACAPSSRFAMGAVSTLIATGVITDLAFGVDIEDPSVLIDIARLDFEDDPEFTSKLREGLDSGLSFASARSAAISSLTGKDLSKELSSPNAILALDYLIALRKLGRLDDINLIMVPRAGSDYSSKEIKGSFASATALRVNLLDNCAPDYGSSKVLDTLAGYMPDSALAIQLAYKTGNDFTYPDIGKYLRQSLITFSGMSDEALGSIAYVNDSISGYLKNFARDIRPGDMDSRDYSGSLFESKIATRRYAITRIERTLTSAITGQREHMLSITGPSYIRVLGFNHEGRYCLKIMGKCSKLPIFHNASDALEVISKDPDIREIFELDMRAKAIWRECVCQDMALDWKTVPVKC